MPLGTTRAPTKAPGEGTGPTSVGRVNATRRSLTQFAHDELKEEKGRFRKFHAHLPKIPKKGFRLKAQCCPAKREATLGCKCKDISNHTGAAGSIPLKTAKNPFEM